MRYDADGKPYEPEWQPVDVIVGNPPFLGAKRMITELGETYVFQLRKLYNGRLAGFSDFVTYWFERARAQLEQGKVKRAGLLATNSIAMGTNLHVLKRLKETGDIFMAWSDHAWVLDGAAVRVSIVGFDDGSETERSLDGTPVRSINADLTTVTDLTLACSLAENARIAFVGTQKSGAFDISYDKAKEMLSEKNPNGANNSDVLFPSRNAFDITQRSRNMWVIDFGTSMSELEAAKYKAPFEHVMRFVRPVRMQVRRKAHRERWWIHGDARPGFREAIQGLSRYLVTPRVSKFRIFVWENVNTLPDSAIIAFAREDDYFFGILHSFPHEIWSLRQGTSLEDRPRYTPTTTFETFPFPYTPGHEDTESPAYQAISAAAKAIHEERDAWLNPPDMIAMGADAKALRERTLTNLYNALEAYRAGKPGSDNSAVRFAPRLAQLHDALDRAVLAAYGWLDLSDILRTPDGDEELSKRLLELNLARANVTK